MLSNCAQNTITHPKNLGKNTITHPKNLGIQLQWQRIQFLSIKTTKGVKDHENNYI